MLRIMFMNDFTKEELLEIKCALEQDLNKHGYPYHQDVLNKVNWMIGKYKEILIPKYEDYEHE